MTTHTPFLHRTLAAAMAAIVALDVLGLIVAVATDLASFGHAFVSGTAINAPFVPFVPIQVAVAIAALQQRHRRLAIAAATLLALISAVSVYSGTQDGSYGADALTPAMTAIQVAIVAATLVAGAAAALVAVRTVRRPSLARA
jgi:hypothetical protein